MSAASNANQIKRYNIYPIYTKRKITVPFVCVPLISINKGHSNNPLLRHMETHNEYKAPMWIFPIANQTRF